MFPALGTKNERRNGGVPQEGNLTRHLEIYRQHVDELVPDANNGGLVVIDFESWRPIFRQNWGTLLPYKDVSYQIEQERHPFWARQSREAEVSMTDCLKSRDTRHKTRRFNLVRSSAVSFFFAGRATLRKRGQKVRRGDH
jgi:hypothetical protein